MLNTEFDQLTRGEMQVGVQNISTDNYRNGSTGLVLSWLDNTVLKRIYQGLRFQAIHYVQRLPTHRIHGHS